MLHYLLKNMEIRFKNTDTAIDISKLSLSKGIYYSIKDDVEGDLNINIALTTDNKEDKSFTRYKILNEHKALVQICNAPGDKYVRTKDKMLLGSYKNDYKLYLQFCLEPEGMNRIRIFKAMFTISKE